MATFSKIELFAQIQSLKENEMLLQNTLFEMEGMLQDQKKLQHHLEKEIKRLEKSLRRMAVDVLPSVNKGDSP